MVALVRKHSPRLGTSRKPSPEEIVHEASSVRYGHRLGGRPRAFVTVSGAVPGNSYAIGRVLEPLDINLRSPSMIHDRTSMSLNNLEDPMQIRPIKIGNVTEAEGLPHSWVLDCRLDQFHDRVGRPIDLDLSICVGDLDRRGEDSPSHRRGIWKDGNVATTILPDSINATNRDCPMRPKQQPGSSGEITRQLGGPVAHLTCRGKALELGSDQDKLGLSSLHGRVVASETLGEHSEVGCVTDELYFPSHRLQSS